MKENRIIKKGRIDTKDILWSLKVCFIQVIKVIYIIKGRYVILIN